MKLRQWSSERHRKQRKYSFLIKNDSLILHKELQQIKQQRHHFLKRKLHELHLKCSHELLPLKPLHDGLANPDLMPRPITDLCNFHWRVFCFHLKKKNFFLSSVAENFPTAPPTAVENLPPKWFMQEEKTRCKTEGVLRIKNLELLDN